MDVTGEYSDDVCGFLFALRDVFPFDGIFVLGVNVSISSTPVLISDDLSTSAAAVFSIICFKGSTIGLSYLSNAISSSILPVFKA